MVTTVTGMLEEIFEMQKKLSEVPTLTTRQHLKYPDEPEGRLSMLCTALIHEIYEVETASGMKQTAEEMIDVVHFVVQISLEAGFGPEKVRAVGFPWEPTSKPPQANMGSLFHDTCRLQRLTPWKWWKEPPKFDRDNIHAEIQRMWADVADACSSLGLDGGTILSMYREKHEENMRRQRDGY